MADLKEKKKYIVIGAVVMVLIVVAAALLILLIPRGEEKKPHATMDDLLNSKSTRAATDPGAVIVALDRPYHVLAATPVALYYDGADKHASPLLVAGVDPNTGEEGTSKAVTRFLEA